MNPWTSQNVVGAKEWPGLERVWVCCVTVSVIVKKVDCEAASAGVAVSFDDSRLHLAHLRISLRTRNSHTIPNSAIVLWVTVMANSSPSDEKESRWWWLGLVMIMLVLVSWFTWKSFLFALRIISSLLFSGHSFLIQNSTEDVANSQF